MRTLRDLSLNRLALSSDMVVAEALVAMQRAAQSAAAIVEDGDLLGIVTIEACVLTESDAPVKEVMRKASSHFQIDDSVRQAAKSFVRQQADFIAVFDGEEFVGLLSALMLITELGRSWDPLTGLSWSDRLRDWGVECLEAGQEITIVFFDLDDFGAYNKRFGHTVGDAVIREFANVLGNAIDPSRDVLVRYGGDEFALGTIRSREETLSLLKPFQSRKFQVKGVELPVTFSFGISGGKRTHEPSRDHVAATLDNLINLASRDCLANKPHSYAQAVVTEPAEIRTERRPLQLALDVEIAGPVSGETDHFQVRLRGQDRQAFGESFDPESRYQGVVEAALAALRKLDSGLNIVVREIAFTYQNGTRFVELWGERLEGQEPVSFHIQQVMNGNIDTSLAKAVVKAYVQAQSTP